MGTRSGVFFLIAFTIIAITVTAHRPLRGCPPIDKSMGVIGSDDFRPPVYYCTKKKNGDTLISVPQFGSPIGKCKASWKKCETCESKGNNIRDISYCIAHDLIDYVDKRWMKAQERVYKKDC
jgi:hypothetical protein